MYRRIYGLPAERRVLVAHTVDGLACGFAALRHRCKLSALLPCEGVVRTVIVAKRVAVAYTILEFFPIINIFFAIFCSFCSEKRLGGPNRFPAFGL